MRTLNQTFAELKVSQHPDKTFIGRIERGFDFLRYYFCRRTVTARSERSRITRHGFIGLKPRVSACGDCLEVLDAVYAKYSEEGRFDMIFADPPHVLSNGGIACRAGKMVKVDKGKWDRSRVRN